MGSAQADNGPHSIVMGPNGATTAVSTEGADQCANCHRAHTAKTTTLTLQAQPLLCLNCHSGYGSTLNVITGSSSDGGALRAGGFSSARIDSGAGATKTLKAAVAPATVGKRDHATIAVLATGTAVTSSHQINGTTTGTMWGNGTTGVGQTAVTLECGACHDPHGNGAYRILKANPDGASYQISAAVAAVPAGPNGSPAAKPAVAAVMSGTTNTAIIADQKIPDPLHPGKFLKNYTTTNYWDVSAPSTALTKAENVTNTANPGTVTDGFLGGISAWCTTCHTRYLSAGASIVGDATYTYKHRSDEQANYKPDCIQCHVAHGTNAVMNPYPVTGAAGVTAPDKTTVSDSSVGKDGLLSSGYQNSSLLRVNDRGTCLMCHAVGGPNPADVVAP